MNYLLYIESDSERMLGKPTIKGTRLTVELIIQRLSEGATPQQLIEAYPALTLPAIQAALAYASDVIFNEMMIAVA
jgi:uncharacterized protein (DUF433 family)